MPVRELPAEVWMRIFPHVRQPIPEPHSNAPRSQLYQQDLTCVIRTCKLFQSIGEKLLYTRVATEQTHRFLPSHPSQIPSKMRLLALTESLYLEYPESCPMPKYTYLLAVGGSQLLGLLPEQMEYVSKTSCAQQVQVLARCLETINGWGKARKLLPKLRTLAVGAIYGGQDETWRKYTESITDHSGSNRANPRVTAAGLHHFCRTLKLDHFCFRGQNGPLGMPWTTFASSEQPISPPDDQYTWTAHITADTKNFSIPYGRPARWVSDSPTDTDWQVIGPKLGPLVTMANNSRRNPQVIKAIGHAPTDALLVDMYFGVSFENFNAGEDEADAAEIASLSPDAKERRHLAKMSEAVQAHLRMGSGIEDKFRWLPSADSGRCPACHSLPPL